FEKQSTDLNQKSLDENLIQNEKQLDQEEKEIENEENSSSSDSTSNSSHIPPNTTHLLQLVDQLSESELVQYESFRRSGFSKALIKKVVNSILGQACNPNFLIAISGISKVFVGEMVSKAKQIQKNWKQTGPLLPSHIHEAYRQLYGKMPNTKKWRRFFE
ncbi:Transcription initiation factor TFIID, subunit TAF11, partial [Pseudoloma neurophilia]